jgi:hypothetical protein
VGLAGGAPVNMVSGAPVEEAVLARNTIGQPWVAQESHQGVRGPFLAGGGLGGPAGTKRSP